MGIALAIFPNLSQAAGTSDTIIVEGSQIRPRRHKSRTTASELPQPGLNGDGLPRYPAIGSVITEQRSKDQRCKRAGRRHGPYHGISSSQAGLRPHQPLFPRVSRLNYMADGIPACLLESGRRAFRYGPFERAEVGRGANGLLTGTGNPAASVNMTASTRPAGRVQGNVAAEYGSWNKQRYVADMQSPLTDDGSVRAHYRRLSK